MSALVNTLLARCMVDADFLALMASDRQAALRGYELDTRTRADFLDLDVRRLIGLATMVTKVQSNGLWQWLPYTRALTVRYGVEQEIFAAFQRDHQALRVGPRTRDAQTRCFLDFLRRAIDEWIPEETPGLRDVFLHERILWEIAVTIREGGSSPAPSGLPAPHGMLRVGLFRCAPSAVIAALREERFDSTCVDGSPRWLVYHADASGTTLRTLEAEATTAQVLALADGTRSVATIACVSGIEAAMVRAIVASAVEAGLLVIARKRRNARPVRR
jgi:hypothetical protein